MRGSLIAALAAGAGMAAAAAAPAQARGAQYSAEIVRTSHGIAHITARDWGGAGYGVGYAYAQDNLCMIAEEFVTVAGERSRWFGPDAKAVLGFEPVDNVSSDLFFRAALDVAALRRGFRGQGREAVAMIDGYVAGYNRQLRDLGPQGVPVACRGKAWVRPITRDDMLRLGQKQMLLASSLALAPAIASAAPPSAQAQASADLPALHQTGVGSNGWAFGGEVTADGRGLLVGNPHFPWHGPSRFWQMHVTIPGVYDVMGVGIAGSTLPTLGFNRDVAWTHTVTAARHFTLFQLALDPADPTAYLVDGKRHRMTARTIAVPLGEGRAPITRTLYASRFGRIVALPAAGLGWTRAQAFAIRDANETNNRASAAWLGIGRARNVGEVREAVSKTLGIPWVNTIAADRDGDILHADVTAVPNVSAAQARDCATPLSALAAARVTLLDGSRAACDWDRASGTPVAGLMPATDQAIWQRRDYLANSNDSYWLSNPRAPYRALSPLLGAAGTERSLRTRSGLVELDGYLYGDVRAPGRKIDHAGAERLAFANHSLAADLALAPTVALCRTASDLARVCDALAKWDGRFDLDSRGAYLFTRYWMGARQLPGLWAVPFDPADPVHTPRDLATGGEQGAKLLGALRAAAAELDKQGVALDARWGDVQYADRNGERIPVHGGDGQLGVLNVQIAAPAPGGVTPRHGSSYVQVVGFDAAGPVADAVLSYSQSTDPASPWYGDQTRLYSAKQWVRLPFSAAEIEAARVGDPIRIAE